MAEDESPDVEFAGVRVCELSGHLLNYAQQAAVEALQHYTTGVPLVRLSMAMHIGNAAEWLLRAALAARNPVLLADHRSNISLVALADIPTTHELSATELRTITTTEVVQKLVHIYPQLQIVGLVKDIAAVRNAAAHMALVEDRALEQAVTDLAELVAGLLPILDRSAEQFWGRSLRWVASRLLEDREDGRAVHVSNKIMAARASWETRTQGLDTAVKRSIRATLEQQRPRSRGAEQIDMHFLCPACGSQAWITFDTFTDLVEARTPAVPDPKFPKHMEVPVLKTVRELWCPVCDLVLEGAGDMSQIPTFFPADRVDYKLVDMSDFWS